MPIGMFLMVHDEIEGPQLKNSYFKIEFDLPQEFISKLYMSHAGFEASSYLEMKFNHHKIVSYFTGHLARQTKSESILGIVFDEEENYANLELFLKRHLENGVLVGTKQTMKTVFQQLLKYLKLCEYFTQFEIQFISGILIVKGTDAFESCLLNLGSTMSNIEIGTIYRQMMRGEKLLKIEYVKLNLNSTNNIFLVIQLSRSLKTIDKVLPILKNYLEYYFDYSFELMALFLLPNMIRLSPLNPQLYKKYPDDVSLLQFLQEAKNYQKEFNRILGSLMNHEIYPVPTI